MTLPDGLYDLLLTQRLLTGLDLASSDFGALKNDASEILADAIARQLVPILDDMAGDDSDKLKRQLELVNGLLVGLRQRLRAGSAPNEDTSVVDLIAEPPQVLRAITKTVP